MMPGREQAEHVDEMRRELGQRLERDYQNQAGRGMTITGNELDDSIAAKAAKEVDQERREIDEINEQMRSRQAYFFEKAQMYREAANHYQRMAEDIAELLNNDYVNPGQKKAMS